MPMLKTITGHTGCAGVMDYLRKGSKDDRRKRRMGEISEADTLRVAAKGIAGYLHDGHGAEFDRALAEDFVGIPPSAQGDWARYMDDLRRAAGCDRRTGGREGKAVTYRHYVLAPDPEDGIDLDTLRAYAKEWVVKAFGPGATAAIVYHDDNHERLKKGLQGIPHAHICINALNTQTGRKWHFAKDDLARQANVAQELAEKYSLAPLPKMRTSDAREDPLKTMRICRTKEECAMLAKGFVPYKESIRKAVAKACRTASSWDQFKAALADKGVSVTITRRGTLTYCDSNGRKAKEQKLGLNFGIVAVGEAIKRNSSESVSLPDVDATPATYDVSLVRRRGKVECRLGTERLVWHEEAGSRWQHLDNIKSLERAAKVKEIYGIVDGESYSRTLSHLNLQLEEAARNQDPAAARIRCEIKSVMYAQAVIDLASARKRIGDEAVLSYSESLLRQGRQLGVANIESIAAIARSNGIDRTEGWRAAVLAAERIMSSRETALQDALVEGSWARDVARYAEAVEAMRGVVGGKSEAAWTYEDASAVQAGTIAERALEGIAESRGESVADVLSKAEGMERSIGAAEAAYFDAARNLSRVSGARDAAYAVAGLEPPGPQGGGRRGGQAQARRGRNPAASARASQPRSTQGTSKRRARRPSRGARRRRGPSRPPTSPRRAGTSRRTWRPRKGGARRGRDVRPRRPRPRRPRPNKGRPRRPLPRRPLRGLHRQHVLQPVDDDELPDLQVEQAAEVPLVEQLLPDEELGLALGFRVGVRADPLDLVVMAVDVRVQMVVAGHEGSDVDPLVNHGRVPVRAPRVRPPVHGHEGGVVLPVPQSPRHHRDVHDTAALFGLRSAHSASAAALLGQNSHIWDDE